MKYKLLRFSLLSVLVMLCGTMVAADKWVKTDPASLTTGDVVAIVDQTSATAMSNDKGTSAAPAATAVTLNDDKSEITGEVAENLQWVVTASEGSYKFGVSGTENYLYCTNTNNGVRVGTNENNSFKWIADAENTNSTESFLVNEATTRYVGVYNNADWRCYTSIINNIKGTVTAFYKKTAGEPSNKTATTVTLAEGYATSGLVGGTIALPTATVKAGDNTIEAATVTWASSNEEVAKIEGNNISLLKAGTAKITASYAGDDTYDGSSASYTVTVEAQYRTIAAMLADITATKVNATYSFENLLVRYVNGSYTYVTDGENSMLFYGSELGLKAGDKINGSVKGKLYTYSGLPELSLNASDIQVTTASSDNEVLPSVIELNALQNNINNYVTIKGATYVSADASNAKKLTFKIGDETFIAYNQFGLDVTGLEADKVYNITGFGSINNSTIQIYPTEIVAVEADEPAGFTDFAVELNTLLTSDDGETVTFGLSAAADGTVTRVAADATNAAAVVTGKTGNNHGLQNFSATVPVEGAVKITMGTCSWGGDVTVKNAEGEVVAKFTTQKGEGGSGCYKGNKFEDENIISAKYVGEATTLTITGGAYVNFFAVEAIEASSVTVAYSLGDVECQGTIVPTGGTFAAGDEYTIPSQNFTLYKEGYTLTGWTDGENTYAAGATITLSKDMTLTPVFTQNEVSLADRTEAVTLNFTFRRDQGAPIVQWQNTNGNVWVTQAEVNGKTIDVPMTIDTNPGKFNNSNNADCAQTNNGTIFTVPSCKGAEVTMECHGSFTISTTTIDGQTDYEGSGTTTIKQTIASSAETVQIVIGDGSYYRYVKVVLPVVASAGGGESYDNVAATIEWPMDEPANYSKSTATPDGAFSTVAVDLGAVRLMDQNGNENATGTSNVSSGVTFTQMRPTNNASDYVTWVVKPASGLTFTPTKVTAYIVRFSTDAQSGVTISAKAGEGDAVTLGTYTAPRNNKSQADDKYGTSADYAVNGFVEIELTEAQQTALTSGEGFSLMGTIGVGNSKAGGIAKVTVSGLVNGTVADVNKYTLGTAVAPEEAGSVSVYPKADEYEEGSEVTLTATENFGYDFVNWTNAAGEEVSTEAKFKYTVNSNETLTANFKKVETYELKLTVDGTNDYMVTVEPAPTVVEGKNMYEAGQAVQLTANQYEGLVTFTNWSDGETNSSKLISMTKDIDITAMYAQADIIAGWDFYNKGSNGRKADFAAQDNDADALNLVNTETGETSGWLDKSTLGGGGYESFKGAAVNWRTGTKDGDVGNWHWQTKVNAEAFTDIKVQFQMLYNYNAYQTYNAEYSLDGENWTKFGSATMTGAKSVASFSETLPVAADNQANLYIRMIADKTSSVDGAASPNDGNTLAMFFITGTPKLVNDGVAPVLVSTVPANGATGASASGKIVLTFDERVKVADNTTATLGNLTLTPTVSGKTVTFQYKGLDYSTEYTFSLPANSVADLTDNFIAEAISLKFTTMVRPTVEKGAYDAVVEDIDGLMTAINAAAARSDQNTRYRIFIKDGEYTIPLSSTKKTVNGYEVPECITFLNSSNVSFIGESRDGVIITNGIDKSETFAGTYGTTSKYDGIGNSDVFQIGSKVSGLYWQDLTVETGMDDATGRDLAIQDKGTQNIYKNVGLRGYQDTWTSNNDNGLYYFEGGYVRGRTDYMCGKGDIFWNGVELRQIAGGYAAVPSKPAKYGWIYKDCVINGEGSGVDGNYTLGRPWGSGTPIALFIDTKMNVVPSAIGWNEMSGGWPARFAEYNSMTSTGSVIDLSGRKKVFADTHENNPELSAEEALENSDLHRMFGDWDPTLATEQAPIPSNVVLTGSTLTWDDSNYVLCWAVCKDGKVVDFTTEATYTVTDNGTYTVRAANEMGGLSEQSAAATYSTGIEDVKTAEPTTTDDAIYTIQGVRVDKARKGLYIIGGRKVVIK